MDGQLQHLVLQVQQGSKSSKQRQQALTELVEHILRFRQICRPLKGRVLSEVHLDLLQTIKQQLYREIEQSIDTYNAKKLPVSSVREWANSRLTNVYRQILNESTFQQLVLDAQRSETKQYALKELLIALQLSGKLYCPHQAQLTAAVCQDAVVRTLLFVYQNVDTYNPDRGAFLTWVNYRLKMILREVQQEQKDPLIQSLEAKIIRTKYQLTCWIRKIKKEDIDFWLVLIVKNPRSNYSPTLLITFILTAFWALSQLSQKNPKQMDSLLFEIARELLPVSIKRYEITGELVGLENIAQPEKPLFLSDRVRQYIQEDPQARCQKHIRGHPVATFQAIALARLDGKSWKDISETFKVKIPALSNFFQRYLKELSPDIKSYIQE